MKKSSVITKDMPVSAVLKLNESLADIFMGFGMHCIFCYLSEDETIAQAAAVHDIDCDFLVKKLNEAYKELQK